MNLRKSKREVSGVWKKVYFRKDVPYWSEPPVPGLPPHFPSGDATLAESNSRIDPAGGDSCGGRGGYVLLVAVIPETTGRLPGWRVPQSVAGLRMQRMSGVFRCPSLRTRLARSCRVTNRKSFGSFGACTRFSKRWGNGGPSLLRAASR